MNKFSLTICFITALQLTFPVISNSHLIERLNAQKKQSCKLNCPSQNQASNNRNKLSDNIIEVSCEKNKDGKLLTMEEAILSRDIWPSLPPAVSKAVADYSKENDCNNNGKSKKHLSAFTKDNNLYYRDLRDSSIHTIAESFNKDISFGQVVSRFEFGINSGFFWSESQNKIAFYQKDESQVDNFPLLDINTPTGSLKNIKYPMNGRSSERVKLFVHDIVKQSTTEINVTDFEDDRYLTNISWSPDEKYIFIQVLNRAQKHLKLNMYRVTDGAFVKTILEEKNDKYVEPLDPIYFIKGSSSIFIYRSDNRDGFKNLYLCDTGGNIDRLTKVNADVEYLDNNGTTIFYTSAEISPVEKQLFSIDIKLKKNTNRLSKDCKISKAKRLTFENGWHNIKMLKNCTQFYDSFSNMNTPYVLTLKNAKNGQTIKNIYTAANPLKDYAQCKVVLGKVKSADKQFDNYYRMYLPLNFDPNKNYPVLLYVYGGPHSQMVQNKWLGSFRPWEMLMAQKGYIVYVQDNRGTQNRGAAYEKAIHKYCGQAEMADQMEGISMLQNFPFVDKERIGVHGWSYGGFMTISLMTEYPDIFKVGVAGGPVIDWKWYEVMYGERYMETMQSNKDGFAKTSLINKVNKLKGQLLICQGAIDNTVVWQHCLSFVNECIKNNIQLDFFPYPCSEHNVYGKDRVHLMDKITNYFDEKL